MNQKIKYTVIPLLIIVWVIYSFFNSLVFETMISYGNEEVKDFVKKSFGWGICFGALLVIFIKFIAEFIKTKKDAY